MPNTLRVLVFPSGDYLVAQCLEYDIAVQAPNIAKLRDRFEITLSALVELAVEHGDGPLSKIGPAPSYYLHEWGNAKRIETFPLRYRLFEPAVAAPREAEMALA